MIPSKDFLNFSICNSQLGIILQAKKKKKGVYGHDSFLISILASQYNIFRSKCKSAQRLILVDRNYMVIGYFLFFLNNNEIIIVEDILETRILD
jgi:hypothetical protein